VALQLEDYLPALEDSGPIGEGKPLRLPLALIDEDPSQPRTDFDDEALRELADTIAARGVRQPISVRRNPTNDDRWILNFGARRLRASRLAGKNDIPAFVDDTADSYDQVIENEHRQALKPLELALFVERQLKSGQSKADVARRLGKSGAYMTYVCALIAPPDWLLDLYRSGKCRGLRELYEARRLIESRPEMLANLLASSGQTPRRALLDRRREVRDPSTPVGDCPEPRSAGQSVTPRSTEVGPSHRDVPPEIKTTSFGKTNPDCEDGQDDGELRVTCRVDDRPGCVVMSKVPRSTRRVFVLLDGDSIPTEVDLTAIIGLDLVRVKHDPELPSKPVSTEL
jgi:ParB family chromosome partitioning protein